MTPPLHAGVLLLLIATSTGCADVNDPITVFPPNCTQPAPVNGIEGTWQGPISGRELAMTLRQVCSGLNFQTFWTVAGTWDWGDGSTGTATFLAAVFDTSYVYLKGNNEIGTFRGLTIRLNENPPFGAIVTGVATGELPATASQTGSWVTISNASVSFARR